MAISISDQEKNIEESIKRENAKIAKYRKEIIERSKKLDDLRRKKLELENRVEEEKKFESDKKNVLDTFEKERKIDDFVAFQKEAKEKAKEFIDDDDWKKVGGIVDSNEKEIQKLQKRLESIKDEHDQDSDNLKIAKEELEKKEADLDSAFEELKKEHFKIVGFKQELSRHKRFIEVAIAKKEKQKTVFYIGEMGKMIQKIEDITKSKSSIIKRLDRKGLEEARQTKNEMKEKFDKSLKKLRDQSDLLEKKKKTREQDILKKI